MLRSVLQAAYLQKAGKRVVVLERRHLLGGAAVTEEIIPGWWREVQSDVLAVHYPCYLYAYSCV